MLQSMKNKIMTKEEIKKEEPEKKTVEVSKQALEKIVDQLEENKKTIEQQRKDIDVLKAVADKSRLYWLEEKTKKIGPRTYKLSTYEGKVIVGWRTIKDEVDAKRGIENQEYEIILEDNKKVAIKGYVEFNSIQYGHQIIGTEVEKIINGDKTTLKLRTDEGKEFLIDVQFVN